jgi:hypothetical protein
MSDAPETLDVVILTEAVDRWSAGTTGTVVEVLSDDFVLVELAGPDGAALDLLDVPMSAVHVEEPHGIRHAVSH